MNYIVFNKIGGILKTIICSPTMVKIQVKDKDNEFIMKGTAKDITQKIKFDGFDEKGQPINPRVVDKTIEEIEVEKQVPPPKIPKNKKPAYITNEQWQDVRDRLEVLENEQRTM